MGIEIIIKKDTIDNLQDKLDGKIPVTYEDLLVLISSHGLYNKLSIKINNKTINIESQYPSECYNLSKLDTSNITDMNHLFMNSMFNGDISNWVVSNVTNMEGMFYKAVNFNQPLNKWNTSKVTNMDFMFSYATSFNQPIDSWDVSSVKNMNWMFYEAKNFNSDIGNWDVSNVTSMNRMFYKAENFNSDINNWNISNVIDMYGMFNGATNFNQNISNWNLDNVNYCDCILDNTKAFLDKYNNSKPLPNHIDELKRWFNLNRDKMEAIDFKEKHGKEVDRFFSNFSNKEIFNDIHFINGIGLNKEI